ncbi:hypothetical protein BHE74_00007328 [Ensete ventricosum]|nr:hypothetical protein BHE74_00007328 [Ensete ventricosum]RZR88071.1 hypothetical protein BHM03_00015585 [Ensete ventricosum]
MGRLGWITYKHEDDLEDSAGLISTPVGVAKECSDKGEDVDGACPFAHVVGCIRIVPLQHPRQEQDQVDSDPHLIGRDVLETAGLPLAVEGIDSKVPQYLTDVWRICRRAMGTTMHAWEREASARIGTRIAIDCSRLQNLYTLVSLDHLGMLHSQKLLVSGVAAVLSECYVNPH